MRKLKFKDSVLDAWNPKILVMWGFGFFLVLILSLCFLPIEKAYTQGTPPFSLAPVNPQNMLYPASFYYQTDDDVTVYDTLRVINVDPTRNATVRLVGKIQGQEGWISFATQEVVVGPNNFENVILAVQVPDGVCEGLYTAYVLGTLVDYDGRVSSDNFTVNTTIAVEMILDLETGMICPTPQPLPGLGGAPSFVPPDSVLGEVLPYEPVVVPGGGGSGILILPGGGGGNEDGGDGGAGEGEEGQEGGDEEVGEEGEEEEVTEDPVEEVPEEVEEEIEEEQQYVLKVLGYPEKRLPSANNWETDARVIFYELGDLEPKYVFDLTTNAAGEGQVDNVEIVPGYYHISFKGLSHLTTFVRNFSVNAEETEFFVDFTRGGQYFLLAGDSAPSGDNFVNSLDLATTARFLFGPSRPADLNADGQVNSLDFSIQIFNLYKYGEQRTN